MRYGTITNMRVVNSFSGQEVHVGDYFEVPGIGAVQLLRVESGLFSARARYRLPGGETRWTPLIVRYTHPSYLLQRVGFIPS
jgi:hypothetical protein